MTLYLCVMKIKLFFSPPEKTYYNKTETENWVLGICLFGSTKCHGGL